MSQVVELLEQLINQYQQHMAKDPTQFLVPHDPQWPSPCEQLNTLVTDQVQWLPVRQHPTASFADIESALGINLHWSLVEYYQYCFADNLAVYYQDRPIELLFPWSSQDFERLAKNLIAHILMKQKLKQRITLFFAVTASDDEMISILNETGEVWLEPVGCEPSQLLANSMSDFLKQIVIR